MPSNFSQYSFNISGYQSVGPIVKNLVAGAAVAEVASFDVTAINQRVTISFAVTGAALTGLEVWARGDTNAEFAPLALTQKPIAATGRTDAGSDVTTTPAGVTGIVMIDIAGLSDVSIRAKSAGASTMSLTAGGK